MSIPFYPKYKFIVSPVFIDTILELHDEWLNHEFVKKDDNFQALVNHNTKTAILKFASGYDGGYQDNYNVDNTKSNKQYYKTQSTVVKAIRKLLNSEEYHDFAVLVDVSNNDHTGGLYVFRPIGNTCAMLLTQTMKVSHNVFVRWLKLCILKLKNCQSGPLGVTSLNMDIAVTLHMHFFMKFLLMDIFFFN